jgi:hypothetical protein
MTPLPRVLALLPLATLMLACGAESPPVASGIQADAFAKAVWSEPVNVGAPVNTSAMESHPTLSPDELSLYFTSNRSGGAGGNDLWVSQRACPLCAWETPVNLSPLNTTAADAGPALSADGHLLFFHSNRAGGQGKSDVYASWRPDPTNDFAWGPPWVLGVSTPGNETAPVYAPSLEQGPDNLYFTRGAENETQNLYYVAVTRFGEALGPAVPAGKLNLPTANDAAATVRLDAREIIFHRGAPAGGLGRGDLWLSTRRSVHDPWSPPENVTLLNSSAWDMQPSLSREGRTIVFTSNRPGGQGRQDIWMATRTPGGQ